MIAWIEWLMMHVGVVTTTLHVLIFIFMLIPGSEPEATLQKILDWIEAQSKK